MFPLHTSVPTRYPPVITWVLIAVNCAVFFVEIRFSGYRLSSFMSNFALIPARYFMPSALGLPAPTAFDYLPFVTNMFLHGGWLHLILNMWTLWLFGPAVEDRLGSGRYLAFYLVCGVLASATYAYFNATSMVPALGASGAIAGVLGCYLRLFPFARVLILIPIFFLPFFFEVHAFLFVGVWFLVQVLQGAAQLLTPSAGGGIAWWAHIGGFVVGLLFGSLLVSRRRHYRRYYSDEGTYGFTPTGRR